jgi:hypothetical protein
MNSQMHEDHDVSRRARQKDTLSAEDLDILLQWNWEVWQIDSRPSAGELKTAC